MSLYWLSPSWKKARCLRCGTNIWDSGGDPDWGYCYECYQIVLAMQEQSRDRKLRESVMTDRRRPWGKLPPE